MKDLTSLVEFVVVDLVCVMPPLNVKEFGLSEEIVTSAFFGVLGLLMFVAVSQVQKMLQAAMREASRIQNCFATEPLFAKPGRGYLKSEGVSTLDNIKSKLRRQTSAGSKLSGVVRG